MMLQVDVTTVLSKTIAELVKLYNHVLLDISAHLESTRNQIHHSVNVTKVTTVLRDSKLKFVAHLKP